MTSRNSRWNNILILFPDFFVKETVKIPNLGRSLKGPKVTSDGSLLLEYTNGGVCDQKNGTRHYAVNITLVCNKELTVCLHSTTTGIVI